LLVIFLTVFIDLIGFGMVLPLLPLYGDRFATEHRGLLVILLMCSFSAMQFLFAPYWGRLSDRIGRRPVLLIGLGGSVVFYAMFGLATIYHSVAGLLLARVGAGIAGATISTAQAYIADVTTLENRSRGMALIGAAFGLGFTLGPLFACFALFDFPAFWTAWQANADWAALGAALTSAGRSTEPGPGPGFAAALLSLGALLLALKRLPESLHEGSDEARKRFNWNFVGTVWRAPSLGPLLLTSFCAVLAFANFESTISLLLKLNLHENFYMILLIFMYIGIVLVLAQGFIARRLAKTWSEGALSLTGVGLELCGYVQLSRVGPESPLWETLVGLAVLVTGFSLLTTGLNSLISRRGDPKSQGELLGLVQSLGALARLLGPALGISLFYEFRETLPTLPLWVAAGLMVVCLILTWWALNSGRDYEPREAVSTQPH